MKNKTQQTLFIPPKRHINPTVIIPPDRNPNRLEWKVAKPKEESFPPTCFQQPIVSMAELKTLPLELDETTYLTIGGGLGSFAWVDHLVIYGVDPAKIKAIGFEKEPHGRYKRLCQNSQIPEHERLRSDSGSTADNIWGWPGYAVREAWHNITHLNVRQATYLAWQIFTEPVFAEPFTPKVGQVYHSIEQEAKRIGWQKIWRYGQVRAIRQTDDGRYVVAYSQSDGKQRKHKLMLTTYLHLAVGYAGSRFLPDLQAYRERTQDFKRVVNAYEDHSHVYESLRQQGGTVIIRGRGIVASRIIQRLYEERQHNPDIGILHLMRTPRPDGSTFHRAKRTTENHFEHQYYNFPKACFGGDLRKQLADASEEERQILIGLLGGTTTAKRQDWQAIIEQGLAEGWYQIRFGQVDRVDLNAQKRLVTVINGQAMFAEANHLEADYIIDATGLNSNLTDNPLLKDLLDSYQLETNTLNKLRVSDDFELIDLRNAKGRVYACGVMTLGGPFAPVDSFVGLQYAAQLSVNHLAQQNAPGVKRLSIFRSFSQWVRWARGVQP